MEDKSYLEYGLPDSLKECLDKYIKCLDEIKKGNQKAKLHWDIYYDELNSRINVCEVSRQISEECAWYLRGKYFGDYKDDIEL